MANETMASKRIRLKADLTQSDFLELVDQPENQTLLDLIPQVVRVEHPSCRYQARVKLLSRTP